MIKPSGASTVSFKMIKKIIEEAFPLEFVAVIKDGEKENKKLLEQKVDFIFIQADQSWKTDYGTGSKTADTGCT